MRMGARAMEDGGGGWLRVAANRQAYRLLGTGMRPLDYRHDGSGTRGVTH